MPSRKVRAIVARVEKLSDEETKEFFEWVCAFEPLAMYIRDHGTWWTDLAESINGTLARCQELFDGELKIARDNYNKMLPKPRFEERDDEIVRLRDEILPDGTRRTFGQVLQLVIKKWPTTQTGAPLTRDAVINAYNRRKVKK